jgi:hypothetical protein
MNDAINKEVESGVEATRVIKSMLDPEQKDHRKTPVVVHFRLARP